MTKEAAAKYGEFPPRIPLMPCGAGGERNWAQQKREKMGRVVAQNQAA